MNILIVTSTATKIRETMSLTGTVLGDALVGHNFELLAYEGTWSKIKRGKDGLIGYIPFGPSDIDKIAVYTDVVYTQLANEAVSFFLSHKKEIIFDGQIDPEGNYILNEDFRLGDVVTVKNQLGLGGKSRINELMYSIDSDNGTRVYPTFRKA